MAIIKAGAKMNIFYDVKLSKEKTLLLFKVAKENCEHWWFDILDCNKSFARQKIDIEFEEALKWYFDKSFPSVIFRDSEREKFLEVGFRAMTDPDYFLWIIVPPDKANLIIESFGLKVRNQHDV